MKISCIDFHISLSSIYRNGKELKPSDKIQIVQEGKTHKLIVNDLRKDEEDAEYTCSLEQITTSTRIFLIGMDIMESYPSSIFTFTWLSFGISICL